MSIDGMDCMINETTSFKYMCFSHKLKGPGVRYEIGLENCNGRLIWTNGPFLAG